VYSYLAAPVVIALFVFWKAWTREWRFGVKVSNMDLDTGRRDFDDIPGSAEPERKASVARRLSTAIF